MSFIASFIKSAVSLAILITLPTLLSCGRNTPVNTPAKKDSVIVVDINTTHKFQTIHCFGASDAWTCQFTGKWADNKRNQIADWLFSNDVDAQGYPKGIGLSMWRFNIGAGSASQDNIGDEWRRTEGFLNKDAKTYDWNKQAGERWFLQAAKSRGVKDFLAFTNSPPIQLTKNGKAYSDVGTEANINPQNYVAFSKFLADVVKHFQYEEKITFRYLSPFNEPQWDWTGNGQEGSPYTNQQIYDITKKLDSVITAEKLSIKIQIGEAGKLNYLFEEADKSTRGNQIEAFFNSSSPTYVGRFATVDKMISGHSYFTSAPVETMISTRENVKNKIDKSPTPIEFWQSEYCLLGDQEEVPPGGKSVGMETALYVARLIHHDLTTANASSWSWWLALTAYDYKDGLIYVDKNKTGGNIEDTKLMWAFGNFSRFIRPGAVRIAVKAKDFNINNPTGLMISSYINPQNKKLTTVIINYKNVEQNVKFNIIGAKVKSFSPYLTSGAQDEKLKPLKALQAGNSLKVPPRSVLTLESNYSN